MPEPMREGDAVNIDGGWLVYGTSGTPMFEAKALRRGVVMLNDLHDGRCDFMNWSFAGQLANALELAAVEARDRQE